MNDLEHDLSRALREQAESLPDAPLSMATVRTGARRIRRRRQGLLAAGVAAVAAVAVPVALLLAPGDDRTSPAPATPPTSQVTPDHARAGNEVLDVTGLPLGPAPLIGYLDLTGEEPVVVSPEGNRLPLETEHRPASWTRLDDGRYVVETVEDGGIAHVELLSADGSLQSSHPSSGSLVVDPDHRQVAFPDGLEVLVVQSGAEAPRSLGRAPGPGKLWLEDLAGSDCFAELVPGGTGVGCVALGHLSSPDDENAAWGVATEGAVRISDPDRHEVLTDWVTAGDPQEASEWVAYQAGIRALPADGSRCSGVHGTDPEAPTSRWLIETCEHRFESFSPDHGLLLAREGFDGAPGHREVAMYDLASRSLLWRRGTSDPDLGMVGVAQWEDDDHVLAPVSQGGEWLLVRFGPDGAMERVTEPAVDDGTAASPPYLPETQR